MAWPTETFYTDGKLSFGNEEVRYGYLPRAHTDGDIYIHFPAQNVLVAGDLVSVGSYPILDVATGGWLGGMVDANKALIELCDDKTRIIPGTGPVQTQGGPRGPAPDAEHDEGPAHRSHEEGHGHGRSARRAAHERVRREVGRPEVVPGERVSGACGATSASSAESFERFGRLCSAGWPVDRGDLMKLTSTMRSRFLPVALGAFGVALGAACVSAFAQDAQGTAKPAPSAMPEPAATPSAPTPPAEGAANAHAGAAPEWKFFDQYCGKCHNSTDWAGGVAFDTMAPESFADDAKIWEEAVRKLRGRLMPPPDKPQPDQQAIDAQVRWLEDKLDAKADSAPESGQRGAASPEPHRVRARDRGSARLSRSIRQRCCRRTPRPTASTTWRTC